MWKYLKMNNIEKIKWPILVLLLATQVSCKAQEMTTIKQSRTINVTGTAEKEVVPDIIVFNISLAEYWKEEFEDGKKYEDYKTKVPMTEIEPLILAQLKKVGVKESQIKVGNIGNYYRQRGKELMISKNLILTLNNFEIVDEIAKTIDSKGVSNLYISELKHSKMAEFEKQVKSEAVKNAKEKAGYMVEAIGEKLGEVINITESEYGYNPQTPIVYERRMALKSSDGGGGAATELKTITIRFEVLATFAIAG